MHPSFTIRSLFISVKTDIFIIPLSPVLSSLSSSFILHNLVPIYPLHIGNVTPQIPPTRLHPRSLWSGAHLNFIAVQFSSLLDSSSAVWLSVHLSLLHLPFPHIPTKMTSMFLNLNILMALHDKKTYIQRR